MCARPKRFVFAGSLNSNIAAPGLAPDAALFAGIRPNWHRRDPHRNWSAACASDSWSTVGASIIRAAIPGQRRAHQMRMRDRRRAVAAQ